MYTQSPTISGRNYPDELKQASRRLLNATNQITGFNKNGDAIAHMVMDKYSVHAKQIKKQAGRLNVNPINLMKANLSYDLLFGAIGCSTAVIPTDNGPIVARNMDWFPANLISQASAIIPTKNGWNAGFLGSVGVVTGLGKGFGLVLNAAWAGKTELRGYPVLLFLRHVLDTANNYDEAYNLITTTPLMSGALITLVGTKNEERVVIERAPLIAAVRTTDEDKPLITTNHYRMLATPTTCKRFDFMEANAQSMTNMDLLTDEAVNGQITSQHIIMQPKTNRIEMYVPTRNLQHVPDEKVQFDMFSILAELGLTESPEPHTPSL
jgi:isopenicillin-N N-acyltransferase-like protein